MQEIYSITGLQLDKNMDEGYLPDTFHTQYRYALSLSWADDQKAEGLLLILEVFCVKKGIIQELKFSASESLNDESYKSYKWNKKEI